jgi:hypothetical protein
MSPSTSPATPCGTKPLGLVNPADAGRDEEHTIGVPDAYDADTPMGQVHMLAPPVSFSHTPPRWRDPILVPRGSSRPEWLSLNGPETR